MLGGFFIGGWSYLNDINEAKGRRSRKVFLFKRDDVKAWNDYKTNLWAQ